MSIHRIGGTGHHHDPDYTLPVATSSVNDISRRVAVQSSAAVLIDGMPHRGDSDFLHAMQGWLGEASDAYLHGHSNIADHVQRMYAGCARFLEDELARQAR